MGIKDLKLLIRKHCPQAIKYISFDELRNTKIAIDTSIYLYKFKYGNNNFLLNFIKQVNKFKEFEITPIYIFDGKPPIEKQGVIDNRKELKRKKYERKEEIEQKLIEYKDIVKDTVEKQALYDENTKILEDELKKLNLSIISIQKGDIESLKELFTILNVQYIEATTEAEIICAQLCKQDIVQACLSDDTDVLANGSKIFLTNYNSKKDTLIKYDHEEILKELKLTNIEFVDLCILCGCDYTYKINKIGYITAYKMIIKYRTLENIIENIKGIEKYCINDDFINSFKYQECRDIFLKTDYDVPQINFEDREVDTEKFKEFIKKNNVSFTI
jgi:flap endonuclease-1